MFKAAAAILLGMLVITAYQLRVVSSELEEAEASLVSTLATLEDANLQIQSQNESIAYLRTEQDKRSSEADERVRIVYRNLPSKIEQDTADPATAHSMNDWVGDLF